MKKFPFVFPKTVYFLLIFLIALSVGGTVWNILNIIRYDYEGFKKVSQIGSIVLNALIICLSLSCFIIKRYTVKKDFIYLNIGFVVIKYKLSDTVCLTHFKMSDKLVAKFNDGKFTVIVISPALYDEFIKNVQDFNPAIYTDSDFEN